jgi:DNA-3-methyladenine glycosylase I
MESNNLFTIRPLTPDDRPWVIRILTDQWGSSQIVSRGVVHQAECLPGFISELDGQPIGLITYHIRGDQCEIVSLNSFSEQIGIATALIESVRTVAIQAGLRRLWLITTNDNLAALRFYQKRVFRLVAVHPNALEISRKLKPEIH